MTERIILDIAHSDDYTDYLFQSAALRNHRIIPLVNPSKEELRRMSDATTLVLHGDNLRKEANELGDLAFFEYLTDTIHVCSKSYLSDDGDIDFSKAGQARIEIEEQLDFILLGSINQQELFREYFPLLWTHRQRIYDTPEFCYVWYYNGESGYSFGSIVFLGAILKAMETDTDNLRLNPPGGCDCANGPILIDYKKTYAERRLQWILHTWCPNCNTRRTIKTRTFDRHRACDRAIQRVDDSIFAGISQSPLNILDVIDALKQL